MKKHVLIRIINREWRQIASQKIMWGLILIMPAVIFFSLAAIYQQQSVKDLPMGVWDQDHSQLSRLIVRSLESTKTFQFYRYYDNLEQIKKDFKRGKLQAAIVIPNHLESDVKKGKSGSVVFYQNSANIIVGNLAYKSAMTTLQTLSLGISLKKMQAAGQSARQAMETVLPISIETNPLYNPGYNYEHFLIGAMLPIMLQMVVMISAALIFSAEIKEGLSELWLIAEGNLLTIVLGKSLPHLFLHISSIFLLVGLVFPIFQIPVHGSVLILILYLILFIASVLFLGMLISCLFCNTVLATEAAIFISTPAFIFTGLTFPLEAMPRLHQLYARLLPSTYFFTGYLKITNTAGSLTNLWPNLSALLVFLAIGFAGSLLLLKQRFAKMSTTLEVLQ